MTAFNRIVKWVQNQRSSTRMGFVLQIICRVLTSVFSLVWTPLLLGSMGKALNGVFLSFQSLASLGGLGDLGMGGLVNVQTSRLLGQGKEPELRAFLAAVRALFLVMTVVAAVVYLAASPSVFSWLKFESVETLGPITGLAIVGALATALLILNSYISNLNYGVGNVFWPVIPAFLILQLGIFGHCMLARQHCPLWLQYVPYVVSALFTFAIGWWYIRLSHPAFGNIRPLMFNGKQFLQLTGKSFWFYLGSVAAGIYLFTSRLLISAGFGPGMVPTYQYNFRLCELALFVVNSACLVSLPKLTQWWASPDAGLRERAQRESERVSKFQTFFGCMAVLVYLAVNDWFIRFWLGKDLQSPQSWQVAFAAHLAVTAAGQLGFDLAARCCDRGIRVVGIAVITTALLNLAVAWTSMKFGSVLGIAVAAVISQSVLMLSLGWYSCRQMQMSWWRLTLRNWLLGLAIVVLGVIARTPLASNPFYSALISISLYGIALLIVVRVLGISLADLRQEGNTIRAIFGK